MVQRTKHFLEESTCMVCITFIYFRPTVLIQICSQEAIVKGAALRGLIGLKPNKRLARRHYGHAISSKFRDGIDDEAHSYWCKFDRIKYCSNRLVRAIYLYLTFIRG